jgi:hypothetical protein
VFLVKEENIVQNELLNWIRIRKFNSWEKKRSGGKEQNEGRDRRNTHYINFQQQKKGDN